MMGWNNTLSAYGFNLSFLITARVGGLVSSATQAMMDGFGYQVTADARDAGGVMIDGELYDPQRYFTTIGINRLGAYYLYDATNIRLQELSIGYSMPKEWLGGVFSSASLSIMGRNVLSIYRLSSIRLRHVGCFGTYSAGGDNFMPPKRET